MPDAGGCTDMSDMHARFCASLQPMIEDLARQAGADWRGEHIIRAAPRAATDARAAIEDRAGPPARQSEKVEAVRDAARAGLSRPEAARATGLSYNAVVAICQRHGIIFPDARRRRRDKGRIR